MRPAQRLERDPRLRVVGARTPRISGVVSTPPKSRDDRPDLAHARRTRVVAPDAGAAVHAPEQERAVEPQPPRSSVGRRRLAGGAARELVLLGDPQLEAGAALVALAVVGGRQRGLGDLGHVRVLAVALERGSPRRRPRRGPRSSRGRDGQRRSRRLRAQPRASERSARSASQSGAPQACPRWPRQSISRARPPAVDASLHAAELLVALHLRGAAGRAVDREASRRRERLEGQLEAAVLAGERHRPARERLVDPGAHVADGDLAPVGVLARRRPRSRRRRPARRRRTAAATALARPLAVQRDAREAEGPVRRCRRTRRSRRRGSRARSAGAWSRAPARSRLAGAVVAFDGGAVDVVVLAGAVTRAPWRRRRPSR